MGFLQRRLGARLITLGFDIKYVSSLFYDSADYTRRSDFQHFFSQAYTNIWLN